MSPAKIDEDPVTAEYDVYITPAIAEQIYLLQYPIRSREQPYNERNAARPTEMRIKPKAGFLEMDIEMNVSHNFNKYRGLKWGESMRKANTSGINTFGAAAGFGPGAVQRGARGSAQRDGDSGSDQSGENGLAKFTDSVNKGYVFHKQTLGGQILEDEEGKPNYMLGAFRGKELHLTRVNGIVQMRPQFHHVDATTHVENAKNQREPDETRPPPQARGLAQSYKDNRDVENAGVTKAKGLMQLAQEEAWTKMRYYDEDEGEAYEAYHEKLFVRESEGGDKLRSSLTNEEYLDAISAPRHDPSGRKKKKPLTRKQRTEIDLAEDDVDMQEESQPAADEPV